MQLPVTIERSSNRSSRAILKDDRVVIRLARGLSTVGEQQHIDILTRRMAKAHAKEAMKTTIDPFSTALQQESRFMSIHPCIGRAITFSIVDGKKAAAVRTKDGWKVTRGQAMSIKTFHRFLWRLVSVSLEVELASHVRSVNMRTLRVPIRSISLKFMQSRWGSCSHSGTVALSTPLLFTTPKILEYVIIHELAHVREMNHSDQFWAIVEKHCEKYRERVQELRELKMR